MSWKLTSSFDLSKSLSFDMNTISEKLKKIPKKKSKKSSIKKRIQKKVRKNKNKKKQQKLKSKFRKKKIERVKDNRNKIKRNKSKNKSIKPSTSTKKKISIKKPKKQKIKIPIRKVISFKKFDDVIRGSALRSDKIVQPRKDQIKYEEKKVQFPPCSVRPFPAAAQRCDPICLSDVRIIAKGKRCHSDASFITDSTITIAESNSISSCEENEKKFNKSHLKHFQRMAEKYKPDMTPGELGKLYNRIKKCATIAFDKMPEAYFELGAIKKPKNSQENLCLKNYSNSDEEETSWNSDKLRRIRQPAASCGKVKSCVKWKDKFMNPIKKLRSLKKLNPFKNNQKKKKKLKRRHKKRYSKSSSGSSFVKISKRCTDSERSSVASKISDQIKADRLIANSRLQDFNCCFKEIQNKKKKRCIHTRRHSRSLRDDPQKHQSRRCLPTLLEMGERPNSSDSSIQSCESFRDDKETRLRRSKSLPGHREERCYPSICEEDEEDEDCDEDYDEEQSRRWTPMECNSKCLHDSLIKHVKPRGYRFYCLW